VEGLTALRINYGVLPEHVLNGSAADLMLLTLHLYQVGGDHVITINMIIITTTSPVNPGGGGA
jgi:hypothetical protein